MQEKEIPEWRQKTPSKFAGHTTFPDINDEDYKTWYRNLSDDEKYELIKYTVKDSVRAVAFYSLVFYFCWVSYPYVSGLEIASSHFVTKFNPYML